MSSPLYGTPERAHGRGLLDEEHIDVTSPQVQGPAEMLPTVKSLLLRAHWCEFFLMSDRI